LTRAPCSEKKNRKFARQKLSHHQARRNFRWKRFSKGEQQRECQRSKPAIKSGGSTPPQTGKATSRGFLVKRRGKLVEVIDRVVEVLWDVISDEKKPGKVRRQRKVRQGKA